MNKNILKLALIGLAAGLCLSVQASPSSNDQEEVAMAKCTRDGNNSPQKAVCSPNGCENNRNQSGSNCKTRKNTAQGKRSAAQKVVQGS